MKPLTILVAFLLFTTILFSQKSYTPDIQLRNTIRKTTWLQLKTKTPQNQKLLMSLVFNSNEPFNKYEITAKQRGWNPYDLSTVASFFKIVCSEVVDGQDYSETEYKRIYSQITSDFISKNIDSELDKVALQKKYDALVLKAFWVASMFELAKKNSPKVQELAKQLLKNNPISSSVNSNIAEVTNKNKTNNKEPTSKPRVEPSSSKSVNSTKEIENIILRTVTSYGLDGVYINNEVNVLYRNGDVFTNPSEPLESFNIALSKKSKPKKWDKWTKKGNIIYVTRSKNGKTYDWKKYFNLRKGPKGFKLNGKFNTSDPFGGATVINASTVVFDNQGRFAWKTIKGGDTAWKPIYSKSSSAGTYYIDKYTITLNYNNGNTESFFFGLYPKDNEHFVVGSSHFVPVKK